MKINLRLKVILSMVFISICNLGQYSMKKELILTNLNNIPLAQNTKDNIVEASFMINWSKAMFMKESIREVFTYSDSVNLIDYQKNKVRIDKDCGYKNPIIVSEITSYYFVTSIVNATYAGEESMANKIFYFWTPWRWYKLKYMLLGIA